jgi:hypothetical protein
MQSVDMRHLLRNIVVKFGARCTNELPTVELPTVRLTISPGLPTFFWPNDSLERVLREVFNEALRSNCGDLPVQIKVCSRARLQDLQAFIGLSPLYWIQISFSGHGLPAFDGLMENRLRDIGYYCDEWIGMENAASQLAILCSQQGETPKLVLYFSTDRFKWECDFLIPVLKNGLSDAA